MMNEITERHRARRGKNAILILILALMFRGVSLFGGMLIPSSIQNWFFADAAPLLSHMTPIISVGVCMFAVSSMYVIGWTLTVDALSKIRTRLNASRNRNAALETVDIELARALQARNSTMTLMCTAGFGTPASLGFLYLYAQRQKDLDYTTSAFVVASGVICARFAADALNYTYQSWQTRYRADNNAVAPGAANQIRVAMPNPAAG